MTRFNPDIHHRRSIRLKRYDYSQEGLYFITICTQNREHFFGEIRRGDDLSRPGMQPRPEMQLNEYGKIVQMVWNELPQHFQKIILHEFIVMPNHIHGIIEIGVGTDCCRGASRGASNRAPTKNGGFAEKNNPMFYENLPRIIRWFKGRITFECRKTMPYFAWQRNYHEHIIRNENAYQTISEYIINNPINWGNDKFYTE